MMRRFALAAALLLSSASGAAAQPAAPPAPRGPSPMEVSNRADAAAPAPTLRVRFGPDARNSGELRVPRGRGPHPVAIVIHGGCWVSDFGGTGMQAFSESLRRRGIATWDIDYRRLGHEGGGWPGTFQDVAAGLDHLPALARRHRLDLNRVTVIGHSAGALFSSWAAARHKLAAPWNPGRQRVRYRSAVMIDGPATLAPLVGADAQVCGRPVIVPLMGGTPAERPAEYRLVSSTDHLPLGVRQLQVLAELGPFMGPQVEAARRGGDEVLTLTPPGANHFDIVTPGTPNGEAVADWIAANAFGTRPRRR